MQNTSKLYQDLLAGPHSVETRLVIGESGRLITKGGDTITFGGDRILVGSSGPDGGFDESILCSMSTSSQLFAANTPVVGSCVSSEIDVLFFKTAGDVPRQARLVPYVRLTNGTQHSEWIQKGVFYVDTRELIEDNSGLKKIALHGYDAMLTAERAYPDSKLDWPARDVDVVYEIAAAMNVPVDSRTVEAMDMNYTVPYPAEYTCRETLGYIAAMYAGCFTMSNLGELRLVPLYGLPAETRYLVNESRAAITFGGDRILV